MSYLRLSLDQPVAYESCGQFLADEGFIHRHRCLPSSLLLIGVEGEVHMQEDDRRFTLKPGDALILRAGHPHVGWAQSEQRISYYWTHFRCEIDSATDSNERPYEEEAERCVFIPQHITGIPSEKWTIHFHELMDMSESSFTHPKACDYQLSVLLMSLQGAYWDARSSRYDSLIYRLMEYLRINSRRALSLQELSEEFGYNPDYLSVYFRRHVGISFKEHIHRLRIQKVKKLLLTTSMSVKEIAALEGYNDIKYFSKVFKNYEHMTPSAYRNTFSNLHQNKT